MTRVRIVDSHTGGEPTRTVINGASDLGGGSMAERAAIFREKHDSFRSAVVNEPRGSDVLVGALILPPTDPAAAAGVIFFNNVGVLGMCGHGVIGVVTTLAFLGKITPGDHTLETPVGPVTARLREDGKVTVRNVPSWRGTANVTVEIPGGEPVTGDVAWGGNWFFLVKKQEPDLSLAGVDQLTERAWNIRKAVNAAGFPLVDHVEFFGPPGDAGNDSRNFVLCPGRAYDRSPCGTGTSAKIACLAADGLLAPGAVWRQESVIGSVFEASYETGEGDAVIPSITGQAWVNAEATLLLDPADPFCHGIRSGFPS